MVRWEPGARERLQAAALEQFAAHGFDGTTVAEIADAAGLTERTFFRHFADKREVLFAGQEEFARAFLDGIDGADDGSAMSLVAAALESAAGLFPDQRRAWSRGRQAVIDQQPGLQERELLKLASLTDELGRALQDRGVASSIAVLAAHQGVAVFRVAFTQWIEPGEVRSFEEVQRTVLAEVHRLVLDGGPGAGPG